MSLLKTIKAAQLQARKDRKSAEAASLTTLIGDAVMVGKNDGNRESTDAEVISTIKKFINNIDIVINATPPESVAHMSAKDEKTYLSTFLPKQLDGDELLAAVDAVIASVGATSIKSLGAVMAAMKSTHEGLYDGKVVSALVKQKLGA
jgi:uncharacterized protein